MEPEIKKTGAAPMITNEIINRAIDYILQHINEELSIDDVAEYCHFSKFYFSRMFKAETGESIYAFIKRLRLEQSAFKLKVEPGRTITDIGCEYGYSSSNYSSAFRQRYRTTIPYSILFSMEPDVKWNPLKNAAEKS